MSCGRKSSCSKKSCHGKGEKRALDNDDLQIEKSEYGLKLEVDSARADQENLENRILPVWSFE